MNKLLIATGAYALFVLLAGTPPRVTIAVMPRAAIAGSAVRVTCRVPRDERNRGLTMGIQNYRSSFVQLDGEAAAVTHAILYEHVPCEAGDAFCSLTDDARHEYAARQPLLIVGCN